MFAIDVFRKIHRGTWVTTYHYVASYALFEEVEGIELCAEV